MTDFLEEVGFELGLSEGFGESRKEERGWARHVSAWGGRVAMCLLVCPSFWDKDPSLQGICRKICDSGKDKESRPITFPLPVHCPALHVPPTLTSLPPHWVAQTHQGPAPSCLPLSPPYQSCLCTLGRQTLLARRDHRRADCPNSTRSLPFTHSLSSGDRAQGPWAGDRDLMVCKAGLTAIPHLQRTQIRGNRPRLPPRGFN